MGANQSSTSEHKVAELLFERGTDAVAVEVHSAAVDSEAVTVFTYFTDSKHRNIATNAIQAHKVLRHPSILKLMTFSESSSSCHVVTEPATPLCACIDYVNGWEITVGLAKILEALHFLHTQAGYSHNNVSMESIYVTPDGEWKLGRLDCVNRIAQNSKDHILSISDLCDSNIYPVPPANEQKAPVSHCRDISGLGKLCEILLDKMESFDQTWLSEFGEAIEVMISPELTEVPTAAEILTQPLLSNPLVLTLKFVEEITLKTETEKQEFFSSLTGRLRELPEVVIAKMLVRPLLRRFVVQEELAYRNVLPCLLTPKSKSNPFGLLSPSLFKKYLPPVILRLFTVKEFRVRILLLDHFHCFCHMLDKSRLENGATKPSGPTREEGLFSELDEETTPNPIPTPSAVTDKKAKGKPIRKTRKQSKSEEKVPVFCSP
ncbi:SCYL3 [Bugula neritina]|uniref:SCYL3 n=1 Tax=Bugula neritina TaxID=10212 RepID=A0A7J7JXX8_BUGNE|nr:SCYL3 [Bugula neritina]